MSNSFLAYYKTVLQKVSFQPSLFRKELKKAYAILNPDDREQLKNWIRNSEN